MPDIFLRAGEANPNDVKLRDPTLADSVAITATATWVQAAASWDATAAETFASTAAFAQAAAAWAAIAAETFTTTATWTQAAGAWDATGSETFTTTAAFAQAAATWAALGAVPVPQGGRSHARPTWQYEDPRRRQVREDEEELVLV